MKKKTLYIAGCAVGGIVVGLFARHLTTILGAVMFTIGVALGGFCAYALTKENV